MSFKQSFKIMSNKEIDEYLEKVITFGFIEEQSRNGYSYVDSKFIYEGEDTPPVYSMGTSYFIEALKSSLVALGYDKDWVNNKFTNKLNEKYLDIKKKEINIFDMQ